MTSFVHTEYSFRHSGVARAENAVSYLRGLARYVDSSRGAAALMLAAVVAAMLVVANQLIETWTDGHLLVAWIALWTVAFAAMAVLGNPVRRVVANMRMGVRRWALAQKKAAEDRKLWDLALTDARVMADISRAMSADARR